MKKIGVIIVRPPNGEQGGAERFYEGLIGALNQYGANTERVDVICDESCFEAIQESYLRFYDLDLSQYFGVISTKAPAYLVRHPNHICYLQHTMRVFYDMFSEEFPNPDNVLLKQRKLIQMIDTAALEYPRTKEIFVIGKEVKYRLKKYNNLSSKILYQSTTLDGFHCNEFDYIFLPGRLHRWKRVDLVIKAMQYVESPVKLIISGTGEDEDYFKNLAKGDARISFIGRVTDIELLKLYSNSLVVLFTPIREDFGLVTLEAFHSKKPVITCDDSGEPTNIIKDSKSGFICAPCPEKIATHLDYLCKSREIAQRMGEYGYTSISQITWKNVAETLIKSLGY